MEKSVAHESSGALLGHSMMASYLQADVPPPRTFNVCVAASYVYDVRQDKTAPCIEAKL
jgi:hypothetical protein